MDYLSHYILDLAENCTASGAGLVTIEIIENLMADLLTLTILDDGEGMPPEAIDSLNAPESQCGGCGLGLVLFARACREAGGELEVSNDAERGMRLCGRMQHSHPNRRPLGDMQETLVTLIMSSPGVDWLYHHEKIRADESREQVRLDTREIRGKMSHLPLAHPEAVRLIRSVLRRQEVNFKD